eukprot:GHUV01000892.1.p1 GENE.GHUV01000892.1~~GHUV01000892.1.p1  ORF type:complete len:448 (+),score=66.60 GHUV01000892.1:184-1527(+)
MGQQEADAEMGVTIADTPNGQSSQVKDADVKAWSFRSIAYRTYCCALEQWFILGLGVAIGFAAAVPRLGATGGYIRAEYSIKIPAIVIIFIISGMGLKTKALLNAAADLRIHLLIQGISLGAIPGLGFAVAQGLRNNGFSGHLADGLVIMSCMPTTVSTNVVYTQRAAGNEAAALVNAVLGNILGIFITPLWLGYFLEVQGAAPYAAVLIEMTYAIIAPLILGQLMQYCTPKLVTWIKNHINTSNVSSFCILLLVWATFCNTFNNGSTKQVPGTDVAATVFLDVALFVMFCVVSFVVAWPPPPFQVARRLLHLKKSDVVAVVICGSTKTVALGVPLINVMYKQVPYAGLLAMPLIIYHALQVLLGGMMLGSLKRWCEKDDTSAAAPAIAGSSSRRWSLAQLLLPRQGSTDSEVSADAIEDGLQQQQQQQHNVGGLQSQPQQQQQVQQ